MKKRSKTKKRTNSPVRGTTARTKKYESHYLAIILVSFLLLEGILISSTTAQDWQKGIEVLDVSSAVLQTSQDLSAVFSPVVSTIDGVNQFYSLAATEMAQILDFSSANPMSEIYTFADNVNQFYQLAATQMAQVLDVSSISSWPAQVAGASASVR